MSEQPVLTKPPSAAKIRAELGAMVVGDLLGPAGGESEELTERTVRVRYSVGVLSLSRARAKAEGRGGTRARAKKQPAGLFEMEGDW